MNAKISKTRCGLALLVVALLILGVLRPTQANPGYPNQVVRLVVGFAPGGSNDILARVLAEKLQLRLKQPVVVENKPGAGGTIAAAFVAGQPADGYTLLIGASGAMTIAPAVYANMQYDTLKDFSAISMLASFPLIMVVPGSSNIKSVKEFVAWTKAHPDKANYATSSPTFTLATELFKMQTGAKIQSIPYRGSGESVMSLVTGQTITTISDTLPAMPLIQSGQVRALALTSTTRVPELPDVPTMKEAGLTDMSILIWTGLFAKKGTPQQVLDRLEKEVRAVMQEADVKKRLRTLVTDAVGNASADFKATIAADLERWSRVAKTAQIAIK